MPDKVIVLNEGPPWGFRMTGGKNTGSPLKIARVIQQFLIFSSLYCIIVVTSHYLYYHYNIVDI